MNAYWTCNVRVPENAPSDVEHSPPKLLLFSRAGCTPELAREAARSPGVKLIGLDCLCQGE